MKLLAVKIITFVVLTAVLISANFALAQDIGFGKQTNDFLKDFSEKVGYRTASTSDTFLETEIGSIISYILGFIGLIFFTLVLYSGFQWMTAGGNEEKAGKAKERIIHAAMGLALIIIAFLIVFWVFNFFYGQTGAVNQINPQN